MNEVFYNTTTAINTTNPDILRKILELGRDDEVSFYAAENKNCPPDALRMVLERDKDDSVSRNAAWNPNCPSELLKIILELQRVAFSRPSLERGVLFKCP